ncbi:MAG TPA: hypothetical protein VLX28_26780, partial [Thermoanaerobaculia bacterium]|nr:hypothetical protein [Thermoanaerobaculia bacterium]
MPESRAGLVPLFLLLGLTVFSAAGATEVPRLLADVNQQPGETDSQAKVAHGFVQAGGRLIFWTTDAGDDAGLWSTDGTQQGTAWLPLALCPDGCIINAAGSLQGIALLLIRTGEWGTPESISLWRTDGTVAGTYPLTPRVRDFHEGAVVEGPGGAFYFAACAATCGIWRSDGTPAGTGVVRELAPGPSGNGPHGLTVWHGRLYFFADDGTGPGLWSTDGTAAGTVFLAPTGAG